MSHSPFCLSTVLPFYSDPAGAPDPSSPTHPLHPRAQLPIIIRYNMGGRPLIMQPKIDLRCVWRKGLQSCSSADCPFFDPPSSLRGAGLSRQFRAGENISEAGEETNRIECGGKTAFSLGSKGAKSKYSDSVALYVAIWCRWMSPAQ